MENWDLVEKTQIDCPRLKNFQKYHYKSFNTELIPPSRVIFAP